MSKNRSPISRSEAPRDPASRRARWVAAGCWAFALVLLYAAATKIDYPTALYETFQTRLGMSDRVSSIVGPALIGYEVFLGGMLVLTSTRTAALWMLAATAAAFLTVSIVLATGDQPAPCGCFGRASLASALGVDEGAMAMWEIGRSAVMLTGALTLLWLRLGGRRDDHTRAYATA